ncbi:hypothetical protein TSUD_286120 [Trifolium subterraneum]|uniref:Uncharacterized protein n=1 Tax=Trifolium subterraneum TaxID=3900 RepID=A0A2Z6NNX7_TRISU|nr:hypothetical protein TSUD_286120 [Trifolium subterraneum]
MGNHFLIPFYIHQPGPLLLEKAYDVEKKFILRGAPVRPRVGICGRVWFGFGSSKCDLIKVNTLDTFPCDIAIVFGFSSATRIKIDRLNGVQV